MVRIVLPLALASSAAATKADAVAFAVRTYQSTDKSCRTETTTPAAKHIQAGECVEVTAGSKYYKLPADCPASGAQAEVQQFTDSACSSADSTAKVMVETDKCATAAGVDIKIASCATLKCDATNKQDMTCDAPPTTTTTTGTTKGVAFAVHTYQSTDKSCGTPTSTPAATYIQGGECVKVTPQQAQPIKYYKLPTACPSGGKAEVHQFTDAVCTTADSTAMVEVKVPQQGQTEIHFDNCGTVAGIDIQISTCDSLKLLGCKSPEEALSLNQTFNKQNLTCQSPSSSDNAMTAGIAGAVLLSASALVIA